MEEKMRVAVHIAESRDGKWIIVCLPYSKKKGYQGIVYQPKHGFLWAYGHTEKVEDSGGNVNLLVFGEVDGDTGESSLLSKLLDFFRDHLIAVFKTKRGYHYYTDIFTESREMYIYIMEKLLNRGLLDEGFYTLIKHRYKENYPYLAVLRLYGKYPEPDFQPIYLSPKPVPRGLENIIKYKLHWCREKKTYHVTELIKCPLFFCQVPDIVKERGEQRHRKFEELYAEKYPGAIIEKQWTVWIDDTKIIMTPDIVHGKRIIEYKSTTKKVTVQHGLMQLALYLYFFKVHLGFDIEKGILLAGYPVVTKIYEMPADEGWLSVIGKWITERLKYNYIPICITDVQCEKCFHKRWCPLIKRVNLPFPSFYYSDTVNRTILDFQ